MSESNFDKFMSDDLKDIVDFYNLFSDRKELIKWIQSVPKSSPRVNIFGSQESEIAVVIPTPTIDHPLALNCQNVTFKGLKVVFSVDSSIFFNLSRSYNIGSRSLLNDQNIRWVIFSNVDMIKIDPPDKLAEELNKINEDVRFCFAKEGGSHSYSIRIGEYTRPREIIFSLLGKTRKLRKMLENKFSIHMNSEDNRHFLTRRFVSNNNNLINFGDFFILSIDLLRDYNHTPFDETYLNGMEDIDLSFMLFQDLDNDQMKAIDYRIGSMKSGIRGRSPERTFRNIPSFAYFNEKMEKIL